MKTLIFDLDGTILDTLPDLRNALNFALTQYELPLVDEDFVRKAMGNGMRTLVKRCVPVGTPAPLLTEIYETFRVRYVAHFADETKPFPGIKEMLIKVKRDHFCVVVSNKDHILTKRLINRFFPHLFNVVQGSYRDKPKKPHPYLIKKVLKENNIKRGDCLYIGDSEIDKESALKAKVRYKLVNYGYRTKEELAKTCPEDTSINSALDLY
ncbi:MAG: HAD family hydrolase, partial [Erysipelotrichia bacterium]|nr:HAD family hydrolase [Erysipelotrichia bacterium]